MVKVSEVVDRGSLEAWLLDRPEDEVRSFAISVAHRAAMRGLPIYWDRELNPWTAGGSDLTELKTDLPILRCILISGVARKTLTSDISAAATNAAPGAFAAAAAPAAFAATAVDDSTPATSASISAMESTLFAEEFGIDATIDATIWKQILNDCAKLEKGDMLLNTPLWQEGGNKSENLFRNNWNTLRQSLLFASSNHEEPTDWSFWINWYEDALEGREPDWDMLTEIALIADEDWKKGPEHINNQVIAGIVEKYAKKEKAGTSAPDTIAPSGAEKKSISQKVASNREALALSIAGVLEQIKEHRERVRKLNSLDPEYKEGLLDFLDRLSKQLSDLLGELPDEGEVVSEGKSEKLALWWREYKVMIGVKARAYATPENISEATVPAGIILGCTGIGAIFGPFGATAGSVVGSLITGQIKPGKAAGELMKDLDAPDSGA